METVKTRRVEELEERIAPMMNGRGSRGSRGSRGIAVAVIIFLMGVAAVLLLAGCTKVTIPDPDRQAYIDPATGEVHQPMKTVYALKPSVDEKIMAGGAVLERGTPAATGIATSINVGAGAVVGGVLGLLGGLFKAYKKYRPQLLAHQDKYDKLALGARVAGEVIETAVKPNAALWEKAKTRLLKAEANGALMPDKLDERPAA